MPNDDQQRLEALKRFFVLDHTENEDVISRLVRVAAQVYGVAYAVLTLRDEEEDRVFATYGFDEDELPSDAVFCARAAGPSIPLTVPDASDDARFAKNPLVHGPQAARFYAGVPLKSAEGFTLGTLALLDPAAQELNGEGLALLVDLGALVEPALNLQRARAALAEAEQSRTDAETAREQADERSEALEAELATTRAERDTARSDGDALQTAYDALRGEHEALQSELGALRDKHETLRDKHETLRGEYETLQGEHAALQNEHAALQNEHAALQNEHAALQGEREEQEALLAERDALSAERDRLAAALEEAASARESAVAAHEAAVAEREAIAAEREAAQAAADSAAAQHDTTLRTLERHERLAAAATEAAGLLAADHEALQHALTRVAPETGATRAALMVKTTTGPIVCAEWHAEGLGPLAEPGDRLNADELDAWADAHGIEHLAALPLPSGLVLLDADEWSTDDETSYRALFAPLAVALCHREADGHSRNRLLAGISHEVRTALTSILGYAEMLGEEAGEEARSMVQRILGSSTRLLQTLDTVLDIARLEAGGGPEALAPIDVGAVVETAAAPFRSHADARDLAFFAAGTDLGAYAWADADALSRALAHLLANAFTFTDQGGIRLRVYAEDDWVGVEVQDTGVGIAPEFLPHLFDEFRREDAERGRDGKGSGLGLALTKRLVDLMGGEITVTSLKGHGSVFRLLLRSASSPHPTPDAAAPGGDGHASHVAA